MNKFIIINLIKAIVIVCFSCQLLGCLPEKKLSQSWKQEVNDWTIQKSKIVSSSSVSSSEKWDDESDWGGPSMQPKQGTSGINQSKKGSDISPNQNMHPTDIAMTASPLSYHALVIGIDQYIKLNKLTTTVNDAQAVASILTNDYGFNTKTLINPTRAEVISSIADYRKQLTNKDALLIYYAGHGWLDKEADEGYWLPIDATEDNEANWISTSSNISASLRAMEARHVLVVADSCYSGKLTRGVNITQKTSAQTNRLQEKKARKVIASGGLEPVADNNGKENHSVFASAFLKSLKENNKLLTATELFSSVRAVVMRNADQTPEFGVIHKAGDNGGDFVFIKKR